MDLEILAYKYAAKAHAGKKHGNRKYIEHPKEVVGVLKNYGYSHDVALIMAGWLHDTIEDTNVSYDDILKEFGEDVAILVDKVTQREGHNRKTRISLTYPHTRSSSRAVALKVADRIANVRHSLSSPEGAGGSFYKMYSKEYPGFREALYKAGEHEKLWSALDDLMSA